MDLQYLSKYRQVLGKSSRTHAVILKEAVEVLATVTIYEEIMKILAPKTETKAQVIVSPIIFGLAQAIRNHPGFII